MPIHYDSFGDVQNKQHNLLFSIEFIQYNANKQKTRQSKAKTKTKENKHKTKIKTKTTIATNFRENVHFPTTTNEIFVLQIVESDFRQEIFFLSFHFLWVHHIWLHNNLQPWTQTPRQTYPTCNAWKSGKRRSWGTSDRRFRSVIINKKFYFQLKALLNKCQTTWQTVLRIRLII